MQVNIKKLHPDSIIPSYSKDGDAGLDLTAVSVEYDEKTGILTYDTGLAFEIPNGFVGMVYPRSSIYKKAIFLSNSTGIIDSGYRGSVKFKFRLDLNYWSPDDFHNDFNKELSLGRFNYYSSAEDYEWDKMDYSDNRCKYEDIYAVGDRIGQLIIIPYPKICFNEVEELSNTDRGNNGYGSTGA